MGKVLYVTQKEGANSRVNKMIKDAVDGDFAFFDANDLIERLKNTAYDVVVFYISKVSVEEELEANKFLMVDKRTPVIIAGEKRDLKKYYVKNEPNIVKYIKTPVLLSTYMNEIKETVDKIEEYKKILRGEKPEIKLEDKIKEFHETRKVLVVDDDLVMLRTINNWLSDFFNVSVAKNGAAALQFLAKEKPDLILLDYDMPVCDGIQTLQMIRSISGLEDIPVFFLTGVDDVNHVKKALDLKPQGYILKGKGPDFLIDKISSYF